MNITDPRLTRIITWIKRTTDVEGGRGALVPVSGGSDSALCFWLCARALPPGRAIAAYVGTGLRCRGWFEALGPVRYLPAPSPEVHPEAARWAATLSLSLVLRCWLVGTRNRTEETFGTYSLASRVATYFPLAGLWKGEVMELAETAGVPTEILASSRQADPSCGRPAKMADIPFEMIDLFLRVRTGERPQSDLQEFPPQTLMYLESIYHRNRFKEKLPLRAPVADRSNPAGDR